MRWTHRRNCPSRYATESEEAGEGSHVPQTTCLTSRLLQRIIQQHQWESSIKNKCNGKRELKNTHNTQHTMWNWSAVLKSSSAWRLWNWGRNKWSGVWRLVNSRLPSEAKLVCKERITITQLENGKAICPSMHKKFFPRSEKKRKKKSLTNDLRRCVGKCVSRRYEIRGARCL